MVSGFICGTSALPRDEDEDYERKTRSAESSPRKSRSSSKNPYSSRGLDRFSALLLEIEEKRQQVYSQVDDPNDISLVRFVYTENHEFKPIIVKAKPKASTNHQNEKQLKPIDTRPLKKFTPSTSMILEDGKQRHRNGIMSKKKRLNIYKQLWAYLAMVFILILVFLIAFNKSFAIMCTSIGWYIVPSITNNSNFSTKSKESFKKKDFAMRRLSEKKFVTSEGTKSFKHP